MALLASVPTDAVVSNNVSGALSSDNTLNVSVAVGAGCVATACIGGAVVNLVVGAPLGAIYYAGLATLAGSGVYAAVADNGSNVWHTSPLTGDLFIYTITFINTWHL